MIEWIKHILGICGEPHGLFYWIITAGGLSTFLIGLKIKFQRREK